MMFLMKFVGFSGSANNGTHITIQSSCTVGVGSFVTISVRVTIKEIELKDLRDPVMSSEHQHDAVS